MTREPAPTRGGSGEGFATLKKGLKKSPKLSVVAGMSAAEQDALGSRENTPKHDSPARTDPQNPAIELAAEPSEPRNREQPAEMEQEEAPAPKKKPAKQKSVVSFYMTKEDAQRARDTYRAIGHPERLSSFSEFLDRAVIRECQRLEEAYNEGERFESLHGTVPRGRPMKSLFEDDEG